MTYVCKVRAIIFNVLEVLRKEESNLPKLYDAVYLIMNKKGKKTKMDLKLLNLTKFPSHILFSKNKMA